MSEGIPRGQGRGTAAADLCGEFRRVPACALLGSTRRDRYRCLLPVDSREGVELIVLATCAEDGQELAENPAGPPEIPGKVRAPNLVFRVGCRAVQGHLVCPVRVGAV